MSPSIIKHHAPKPLHGAHARVPRQWGLPEQRRDDTVLMSRCLAYFLPGFGVRMKKELISSASSLSSCDTCHAQDKNPTCNHTVSTPSIGKSRDYHGQAEERREQRSGNGGRRWEEN